MAAATYLIILAFILLRLGIALGRKKRGLEAFPARWRLAFWGVLIAMWVVLLVAYKLKQ
jgi:hypothetical protein